MNKVLKKTLASLIMIFAVVILVACEEKKDPSFSGLKDLNYTIGDVEPNYLDGVKAFDEYEKEIKKESIMVNKSNVNLNEVGTYDVIYSFNYGKNKEHKQTVRLSVEAKPRFEGLKNLEYIIGNDTPDYLGGVKAFNELSLEVKKETIAVDDSKVNYLASGTYDVKYSFVYGNKKAHEEIVKVVVSYTKEITEASNYITEADYSNILNKGKINLDLNLGNIETPKAEGMPYQTIFGNTQVKVTGEYDLSSYENAKANLKISGMTTIIMQSGDNQAALMAISADINIYIENKTIYVSTVFPLYGIQSTEEGQVKDENGNFVLMKPSYAEATVQQMAMYFPKEAQSYMPMLAKIIKTAKEKQLIEFSEESFTQVKGILTMISTMIPGLAGEEAIASTEMDYNLTSEGLSIKKDSYDLTLISDLISGFTSFPVPALGAINDLNILLTNEEQQFKKLTLSVGMADVKINLSVEALESVTGPDDLEEYVESDNSFVDGVKELIEMIIENSKPIITLSIDETVITEDSFIHIIGDKTPSIIVSNKLDSKIKVTITGTVNFDEAGEYVISYKTTDLEEKEVIRVITYYVYPAV